MQLLIENILTAQTEIKPLGNRSYQIGKRRDCDIVLTSNFVAPRHALIAYLRPTYSIQPSGASPTYVNDRLLARGERQGLFPGDRIRIGDYVLSVSSDTETAAADVRKLDLAKKFAELELKYHNKLLERMDLRKITFTRSEEHVQSVHQHLSVLLNEFPFPVGPEIEQHVIRETLKTELMDWAAFQGGRSHSGPRSFSEDWSGHEEEVDRLRSQIVSDLQLSTHAQDLKDNVAKIEKEFDAVLKPLLPGMLPGLRRHLVKRRLRKDLHDIIFGLGPLEDLLHFPNITEIMVVNKDQIYIEKDGIIEESGRAFVSDDISLSIIERIVSPIGRRIDRAQPLVDARLLDGSRVNAIIPPLAIKGPCITIRKFAAERYTMDDLIEKKTLNNRAAAFLRACVVAKKNIMISGGTGSGKTTLLNVLSSFIGPQERVVTIEDSAELQLAQKHVVQLETRPKNIEGGGEFRIQDLLRNALRMRPDRIMVGECRGAETLDMLQAMNTGHSGSMTTAHANTPEDLLLRVETMVLQAEKMPLTAIRAQIGSALDVIIQQSRLGGARRVTQITEVVGFDQKEERVILEDVFVYRYSADQPELGELIYTGYIPTFMLAMLDKGILNLEEVF
jgi:Flp pilus assembly CpaF family ATPase